MCEMIIYHKIVPNRAKACQTVPKIEENLLKFIEKKKNTAKKTVFSMLSVGLSFSVRLLFMILPAVVDGEASIYYLNEPHAKHLVGKRHF